MLSSKFSECNSKKSKFHTEQEARGISSLKIRTLIGYISLLGPLLFSNYKMN